MEVIKSIIPVLFFSILNSAVCIKLQKGFGKTLPITMIVSVFILFFSQLIFSSFKIGIYLLYLLAVVSLYFIYKDKNRNKYIFTNGFYIFICLYLVFAFINFGKHFYWDDELGFWGKMVKEMIRLDKFYYLNESTLRGHNDYPPFSSLFELLWSNLSLGFSEANVTIALQMFEFSLLVPSIFDDFNKDKRISEKLIIDLLICVGFVGIVLYLDADDVFNSIYVDTLLAMEFAYASYLIFSKEVDNWFGVISYALIMSTIIMTKQVGIAFTVLGIFFYIIYKLFGKKEKKNFVGILLVLLVPVGFYLLWNTLIKPYDIVKQFDFSKISINGLKEVLSGVDYRFEAVKLYINALFKRSIYAFPIPITFVSSVILEILLLVLINKKDKINSLLYIAVSVVGSLGYALMMFILYAFCYPEREALVLISYNRYMSSFLAAMLLSILILYVINYEKKIKKNIQYSLVVTLLILLIFDGNRMLNFVPQVILGNRFTKYENLANKVKKDIEPGDSLYILYDHNIADSYPAFTAYYLDEIFVCKVNTDFNEKKYTNNDEFNEAITELGQYNYIYVVEASDLFNEYFAKYNNNKSFEKETLYRVNYDNDIRFEKVN